MSGAALEKNSNWKGGRTIASNGYVLIKAPDNPMADVRGYVYEHRLVASQKIGRLIESWEEVHHKDENKQNNDPDNLEVLESKKAHHMLMHRMRTDLRKYGEDNPVIACECGCGETFQKYDNTNRPRVYISGHNPPKAEAQKAIIEILKSGPKRALQIASIIGKPRILISSRLSLLKNKGIATNTNGVWRLTE